MFYNSLETKYRFCLLFKFKSSIIFYCVDNTAARVLYNNLWVIIIRHSQNTNVFVKVSRLLWKYLIILMTQAQLYIRSAVLSTNNYFRGMGGSEIHCVELFPLVVPGSACHGWESNNHLVWFLVFDHHIHFLLYTDRWHILMTAGGLSNCFKISVVGTIPIRIPWNRSKL